MSNALRKQLLEKYCPRFGQIAVESGFITEAQLAQALAYQVNVGRDGREHRLLGEILFEKEWMSASQIDQVMTELCKRMRLEHEPE